MDIIPNQPENNIERKSHGVTERVGSGNFSIQNGKPLNSDYFVLLTGSFLEKLLEKLVENIFIKLIQKKITFQ